MRSGAAGPLKGFEIMFSRNVTGRRLHGAEIEGPFDKPRRTAVNGRRQGAVQNAVVVGLARLAKVITVERKVGDVREQFERPLRRPTTLDLVVSFTVSLSIPDHIDA